MWSDRILIVVDEELNLELIHEALGILQLEADFVNTAAEAISYLRDCSRLPLLVLSDLMSKSFDGVQLLSVIRVEPQWKDIPFLAVATAETMCSRNTFQNFPVDGFLEKPFKLNNVFKTISDLVQKSKILTA